MPDASPLAPGAPALRRLGLIGDPFAPSESPDTLPVRLVIHAAVLRFLSALDASAGQERSTPVWVEKSEDVPAYYHLATLAQLLAILSADEDLDMLAAYVPLDLMSLGRTRAPLSALAERLSNPTFGRTLGLWAAETLRSFDGELPEAGLLDRDAVSALLERLEADPEATVARYFGEYDTEREASTDLEKLMRVAGARQSRLEQEPAEEAGSDEQDESDPMADFFVEPMGEGGEPEVTAAETGEAAEQPDPLVAEGLPAADDLVEYVLAYTRAHLSPVVARGLLAYRVQGASAMAQELKITKAPKKTIAALARFASHRYRKTVLLYDRFDNWNDMPDDNKPAIIGSISELRFVLATHGIVSLLVVRDQAPELAEQFAGASRVVQDFSTLPAMEQRPPALTLDTVRAWVEAASVGEGASAIPDDVLTALIERAEGDVETFASLGSAAVQGSAARGLDRVDLSSIEGAGRE